VISAHFQSPATSSGRVAERTHGSLVVRHTPVSWNLAPASALIIVDFPALGRPAHASFNAGSLPPPPILLFFRESRLSFPFLFFFSFLFLDSRSWKQKNKKTKEQKNKKKKKRKKEKKKKKKKRTKRLILKKGPFYMCP
jgi:hypothetical protein